MEPESRAISSLEAEARAHQHIASFCEKMLFISLSTAAGAIAVSAALIPKIGHAAPVIHLFRALLTFMATAICGLYGFMRNTVIAYSRLYWVSYINDGQGRVPFSGWRNPASRVAQIITAGTNYSKPTSILRDAVTRHILLFLMVAGFAYGLEQFFNFSMQCLYLTVTAPSVH